MKNLLNVIGRILISLVFLYSGVNKILKFSGTQNWMEGFGIPGVLLFPAIIIEIVCPILIIIGYKAKVSAGALIIFCFITAFVFHFDFSNQMQIIALLKNLGLAGGLIFILINGTGSFSIEKEKKHVRL